MKVVIISHSDTRGGAAVAAMRLMLALRAEGHDARMLVAHKGSADPNVSVAGPAWRLKMCFLREHLTIFLRNGLSRSHLFQASIANCGLPLSRHPWVREADAVVLGWVNQGLLSLREIGRIQAPVTWIMHDMWNLTGVCHHAGECQRYKGHCGCCPLLASRRQADLSRSAWLSKQRLYDLKSIRFVAVSRWLAGKCNESELMAGQRVDVVPNPFPAEEYYTEPARPRSDLGLPEGKCLIAMGAARLDDPVKGLELAIDALNAVKAPDAAAVFFGGIRDASALARLKMPYVHLGPVDLATAREVYAHADVVLSSSLYETLPTTLIEGMAAGCVPVTFGDGGQADIVDHLSSGYIARRRDSADLAAGIDWALAGNVDKQSLPGIIRNRFGARAVAKALGF